ncbi:MAG: MgtC/SapB family protein [Candidatus Aenigmatarchaeota archaeon]
MQVLVALAIGGLIGLERERKERRKFAGVRTLAFLCGAGPVTVYVSELLKNELVVALYLVLGATLSITIAYIRFTVQNEEVGLTTSVVVFLVTLLGVLVGYGRFFEATSIALITMFLLVEKKKIHKYVDQLTYEELSDSMKLGMLVFVLYPILPTEPIGPYGIINLREVLTFAIFVLMIEFIAYISMKQLGGSRGLQVTGLFAGCANSFATAGVLSRMAKKSRDFIDGASSALLLANSSMIVRNLVIASVLAAPVLGMIWAPVGAMIALSLVIAYFLYSGENREGSDISMDSPFSFRVAAKFSAAYIVILVISVVSESFLGQAGLYMASFAGGIASSAAVAVSAATIYNNGVAGVETAAGMIVFGILASSVAKLALVGFTNKEMGKKVAVPMASVGIIGLLLLVFV